MSNILQLYQCTTLFFSNHFEQGPADLVETCLVIYRATESKPLYISLNVGKNAAGVTGTKFRYIGRGGVGEHRPRGKTDRMLQHENYFKQRATSHLQQSPVISEQHARNCITPPRRLCLPGKKYDFSNCCSNISLFSYSVSRR